MKKSKLFFEVVWPLCLLIVLLLLPTLFDAMAKEEKPKLDRNFLLEESEKSFQNFSKITNQANQAIGNKVQSIKNEVLELKEEVQETKDLLIKAEEKNANYETKFKEIDSVERNVNAQPFDILAILPDSAR
jgi:peptidoglycan hydrolase CwlO-like protein